jgi:molecular chaperone GrpE
MDETQNHTGPGAQAHPGPGSDGPGPHGLGTSGTASPDPSSSTTDPPAPVTPEEPVEEPAVEPSVPAGDPEAPVAPAVPTEEPGPRPTPVGEPGEDHERKLEADLEELTARADKADEYLELARRTKADFENYRRRATRDAAAAQERGIARLAKELLPAVDNLDRAVQAAESEGNGSADQLVSGIKLVHADVLAALQRAGIERFSPQGEPFDPQLHEALAQQPVEGATPGTVVEVYQQGYRLGEVVIRPARVVVAG